MFLCFVCLLVCLLSFFVVVIVVVLFFERDEYSFFAVAHCVT